MKSIFNAMISVFVWLGVFEMHLVKPLLTEPLGVALQSVTFIDILLLGVTAIVVTAVLAVVDRMIDSKKTKAAIGNN